jgi:TonB family protein
MRIPLTALLAAATLGLCACGKEEPAQAAAPEAGAPAAQPAPAAAQAETQATVAGEPAAPEAPKPSQPGSEPVATYQPKPQYPPAMWEQNTEGEVQVDFTVTREGTVENVSIRSATQPAFADALLQVLPQWRFIPSSADGQRIDRRVSMVVPFTISDRSQAEEKALLEGTETQPLLARFLRPANPGKHKGEVVARISITATSFVQDVQVVENTAGVDPETVRQALRNWLFLPFVRDGSYVASDVLVGITYAPGAPC